jgi:hypothetical protein
VEPGRAVQLEGAVQAGQVNQDGLFIPGSDGRWVNVRMLQVSLLRNIQIKRVFTLTQAYLTFLFKWHFDWKYIIILSPLISVRQHGESVLLPVFATILTEILIFYPLKYVGECILQLPMDTSCRSGEDLYVPTACTGLGTL